WKGEPVGTVGQGRRVACFVLPGLEVHRLAWADTEQNSQHFGAAGLERQGRIKAAAGLLDRGEMECSRVGNRLEMGGVRCIGIVFGDCPKLPLRQIGDRLRKHAKPVEIGIMGVVAVTRPKARIDGKLQEVGKPPLLFVGSSITSTPKSLNMSPSPLGSPPPKVWARAPDREATSAVLAIAPVRKKLRRSALMFIDTSASCHSFADGATAQQHRSRSVGPEKRYLESVGPLVEATFPARRYSIAR